MDLLWEYGVNHIDTAPKFLNTVGDLQELPKFLKAADGFAKRPAEEEMNTIAEKMNMQMLFN